MGTDFNAFASQLLEESKGFLEKAGDSRKSSTAEKAYLHAALMLSFCALEAYLSAIGQVFSTSSALSLHEKCLLLERDVRLENGEFTEQPVVKMWRIEDRIEFLHAKFSGKQVNKSAHWWGQLQTAIHLRNELTHAKSVPSVTQRTVKEAVLAILGAIDALCLAIHKKRFPLASYGLTCRTPF
jgi:hypothetical protein